MFNKRYYFKALDQNGNVYKKLIAKPSKKKAFLLRIRTLPARKGSKYYLKVAYGLHEDNWGKQVPLYNEGWYTDRKYLAFAFKAFDELNVEDFK